MLRFTDFYEKITNALSVKTGKEDVGHVFCLIFRTDSERDILNNTSNRICIEGEKNITSGFEFQNSKTCNTGILFIL